MTELSKKDIRDLRRIVREWDAGKSDPTYTGNAMADLLERVILSYDSNYER